MSNSSEDVCPVDPSTRAAWLKANPQAQTPFSTKTSPTSCDSSSLNQDPPPPPKSSSASSSLFSRLFWASPSAEPPSQSSPLSTDRVISSIPRTSNTASNTAPANNEIESGTSANGKWIYPSEKMFFEAMKRKGYSSDASDMKTVVPIHNAVNERAWMEIKRWEKPWEEEDTTPSSRKCFPPGPRLRSFTGLGGGLTSPNLSPRAKFNSFLGYTAPFDRHDWIIERCPSGRQVEYIIDFYSGSNERGRGGKEGMLNFYLDVRPKLNSWEGCKMRGMKAFGLV